MSHPTPKAEAAQAARREREKARDIAFFTAKRAVKAVSYEELCLHADARENLRRLNWRLQ